MYKLPIKDCICPYVSENIVLRVRCGLRHNPAQTDGCASANISAVLYHTRPWLMMSLFFSLIPLFAEPYCAIKGVFL